MENYTSREELIKKLDTTKGVTICVPLDQIDANDDTRVAAKEPCAICRVPLAIHKDTVDNPTLANTLKLCYKCATAVILSPLSEKIKNEDNGNGNGNGNGSLPVMVWLHTLVHPLVCNGRLYATLTVFAALGVALALAARSPVSLTFNGFLMFFWAYQYWRYTHNRG